MMLQCQSMSEFDVPKARSEKLAEKLISKIRRTPVGMIREKIDIEGTQCEWISYEQPVNLISKSAPVTKDTPMITIIYLHGGGYCLMSVETHLALIGRIISATGSTNTRVMAVDYKLAPEYPFPHALNEVVNVYKWLLHNQGLCPTTIFFVGDSAGI
jgi:monoterpene epsilon-lactone hydrolase